MPLHLGIQTIVWGERFDDGIDNVLQSIADRGFQGVEFAQVPHQLGSPLELPSLLHKRGLKWLGLAGGRLQTRLEYCNAAGEIPSYLYIQAWDEEHCRAAISAGYTLALHPHLFTQACDSRAVAKLLTDHPELKLLPDTAHLFLRNVSMIDIVLQYPNRLAGMHMKDWRPRHGWSLFTYPRGFCELGRGIVPLKEVLAALPAELDLWLILEQDSTESDPLSSIDTSLDWLQQNTNIRVARKLGAQAVRNPPVRRGLHAHPHQLIEMVASAERAAMFGVDALYGVLLDRVADLFDIKCASIWEICPRNETMMMQAFWEPQHRLCPLTTTLRGFEQTLSGRAVIERTICVSPDVRNPQSGVIFRDAALVKDLELDCMISIPISNQCNINQPEILLNVFPRDVRRIAPEGCLSDEVREELSSLAGIFAMLVEQAWTEMRMWTINEVAWAAGMVRKPDDLLRAVLDPLRTMVRCKDVAVYVVNAAGTKIERRAFSDNADQTFLPFYRRDHPFLARILDGRAIYNNRADNGTNETTNQPEPVVFSPSDSALLAPLFRHGPPLGEPIGVIWCRGKTQGPRCVTNVFSVTDEIIVDALQSELAVHFQNMSDAESRNKALTRVTHELKNPIVVSLGATAYMGEEIKRRKWTFEEDYLDDIKGYLSLMRAILNNTAFLKTEAGVSLRRTRVQLLQHVIAPAVRQVRKLLDDPPRPSEGIRLGQLSLPAMFLDRARFQQVFFNLLNNAIKYSLPDPEKFKVVVLGKNVGQRCELKIQDWGTGIDPEMAEKVFEEGVRGENAQKMNVAGDGFGLWIAREILKAHGAEIAVTGFQEPTEFTISLPASLQELPAELKGGEEDAKANGSSD